MSEISVDESPHPTLADLKVWITRFKERDWSWMRVDSCFKYKVTDDMLLKGRESKG